MQNLNRLQRIAWWTRHPIAFVMRIAGGIYRRFNPMEPWLSRRAIQFFDVNLKPHMQGIEWGSGRSTIWFSKRLGKLLSVEHNQEWHAFVTGQLKERGITNVDYRFISLDHPQELPTHPKYEVTPRYVAVAEEFADDSLDFVLIDGHYRQACVPAALKKLKKGGYLTIDNSNWMPQSQWGVPATWPLIHKTMGFDSETSIWQKP